MQYPTIVLHSFPPSLLADRQRHEACTSRYPLSIPTRWPQWGEEVHALPQAVRFELRDQDKLHIPKLLPRLLFSSVIRSTHQGESHGGLYLADLRNGETEQVLDWNDAAINWEGRGADRGLRGIAFHEGHVYLAASDEVFVYDTSFQLARSFRNRYLKHCHEIHVGDGRLFLTSTGFDSILEYDLQRQEFSAGYCVRFGRFRRPLRRGSVEFRPLPRLSVFDPNRSGGPRVADTAHVNSVRFSSGSLFVSGTRLGHLLQIQDGSVRSWARIPYGSHNAQPFRGGVLLNQTEAQVITYLDRRNRVRRSFRVPSLDPAKLTNASLPSDHARPGFARGLAPLRGRLLAAGSSPATVSLYHWEQTEPISSLSVTFDVRNAVHGLEWWPFDREGISPDDVYQTSDRDIDPLSEPT